MTARAFLAGGRAGLVLAGGGARGAYQVGCWRAMEESGLRFQAVAGTSVGALNAAFYLQSSWDHAWYVWENLRRKNIFRLSKRHLARVMLRAAVVLIPHVSRRRDRLVRGRHLRGLVRSARSVAGVDLARLLLLDGFLSPAPLERLLERTIDAERILSDPRSLYIGVEEHSSLPNVLRAFRGRGEVRYFVNHQMDAPLLREVLLASAAIPGIFPQRRIEGRIWGDPGHTEKAPLTPLLQEDLDRILVIHLTEPGSITREWRDEREVVHLRPSRDLGHFLAFGRENARKLLDLGYEETKAWLEGRRSASRTRQT